MKKLKKIPRRIQTDVRTLAIVQTVEQSIFLH